MTGAPSRLSAFLTTLGVASWPGAAQASGYGDWTGVAAAVVSFGLGIVNGLVFLAIVALRERYTIWSSSRIILLFLLFGLSETAVFGLTLLIWDGKYADEHFSLVASGLNLLHPAIFLVALRLFRKDTATRTVWKINAVAGGLAAVIAAIVMVVG